MYCEDNEGTDIDHFRPKSTYPTHAFDWSNYFSACSHCNSNEKRVQFPLDERGEPLLIDPAQEDPYEHIVFIPETGHFAAITPKGEATVEVFGLQRREALQQGRQDTWRQLGPLMKAYQSACRQKNNGLRAELLQTIRRLSFQSVVQHYIREALSGSSRIPSTRSHFLRRFRADFDWLGFQ